MELAVSIRECASVKETWTIHHLTDLHVDDPDHSERELAERVAEIEADPRALWLGGGDYGSLILPNDPRFQTSVEGSAHRLPDVYLERVSESLAPIAGKCLGIGTGNHEDTIAKHYHRGVGAELAMRLDAPELYLGTRGWAVVRFRRGRSSLPLRCFQYHGWSSGRLRGRKALQAERDVGAWRADALFLGHDHQPYAEIFWAQEAFDSKRGWGLRTKPVAVVNGGSWTYGQRDPASAAVKRGRKASEWPSESWSETKNFRPQPPESPRLLVHLDFGHAVEKKRGGQGRPAGFELEIRRRATAR